MQAVYLLFQDGNFPVGDGSPRGSDPAGMGLHFNPWGKRGGAPKLVRGGAGGMISLVGLHGAPSSRLVFWLINHVI